MPAPAAEARPGVAVTAIVAWLFPGAGHIVQGQWRKAVVFCIALVAMFAFGLACEGRLFPFQRNEPLVFLAATAQWALAAPRIVASLGGWGQGTVTAATYEYGNTFLIVSGLLNALVVLDACDLAADRKPR